MIADQSALISLWRGGSAGTLGCSGSRQITLKHSPSDCECHSLPSSYFTEYGKKTQPRMFLALAGGMPGFSRPFCWPGAITASDDHWKLDGRRRSWGARNISEVSRSWLIDLLLVFLTVSENVSGLLQNSP